MDQWTIFNVEEHIFGDQGDEAWVFDKRRPGDPNFARMFFPKSSPAWRAAEYDMDPSTPDGLAAIWDLLLHEPYMPSTNMVGPRIKGQPAPAQLVHLYNAPTKAAARDAHLARLAEVKRSVAQVNWPKLQGVAPVGAMVVAGAPVHPMLQRVLSQVIDPVDLQAKRDEVHGHRVGLGLEVAPAPVIPTVAAQYFDESIQDRLIGLK